MRFWILPALALLLHNSAVIFAQQWPDSISHKCNTAINTNYFSKEEKDIILYINMVRIHPQLFAKTYLKNYLDTAPIAQTSYLKSLLKELNEKPAVGMLEPQIDLFEMAKKHATEMGNQGKVGHVSIHGEPYEQRAAALSKRYDKVFENCQYGYKDALSVVIDLLIDEDIPNVSHRKSLMNSEVKYIGVAIRKHKTYHYNTVIELSGRLQKSK